MKKPRSKIITMSLADMLAEAIARIQSHQSVSALFSETTPHNPSTLPPRT
jgi:phosphoribosylpyrophosphate synthetase